MSAPVNVTYLFPLEPARTVAGTVVFRHNTKVIGLITAVSPHPSKLGWARPEFSCEVVWQNGKRETVESWSLSDFDAYFAYEERERVERLARRASLARLGAVGPPLPL
jgi:hypothetical protein